jgi:hypothetical protein
VDGYIDSEDAREILRLLDVEPNMKTPRHILIRQIKKRIGFEA